MEGQEPYQANPERLFLVQYTPGMQPCNNTKFEIIALLCHELTFEKDASSWTVYSVILKYGSIITKIVCNVGNKGH